MLLRSSSRTGPVGQCLSRVVVQRKAVCSVAMVSLRSDQSPHQESVFLYPDSDPVIKASKFAASLALTIPLRISEKTASPVRAQASRTPRPHPLEMQRRDSSAKALEITILFVILAPLQNCLVASSYHGDTHPHKQTTAVPRKSTNRVN